MRWWEGDQSQLYDMDQTSAGGHYMLRAVALIALALAAVGGYDRRSEDLEEVRQDQREILFRLGALTKAIEQAGSHAPTAADIGNQPPKAYEITLGESPVKGPKDA